MAKRTEILGGIVLALATAICFWPLSRHPGDLLVGPQRDGQNDLTNQILAFRGQQSGFLRGGFQALAWNPFSLGGIPWLGNPQTAMLYPPHALYAVLASERAVSWLMVGHHWLAGLGTYLLCRRYGLAWSASVLAGVAFLAAPYYVANTGEGHYNPVCLIAWVPWAFLFVERLRAGQRGGVVGTTSVLTLTFFCGHVQELFYLVLLLTAFLAVDIVRGFRPRRQPKSRRGDAPDPGGQLAAMQGGGPARTTAASVEKPGGIRIAASWAAVGFAVAGLTAIELLPNWIYSRHSVRAGGLTMDNVRLICLHPTSLLQLLDPVVMGGPADYRGPGMFYWEAVCHFGVIPLLFAFVGACVGFRRYPVARFSVLWLATLLFAFGPQSPLFPLLYHVVPGIALFRAPARALFFCSFFTAVLAGVAFDAFLTSATDALACWRRRLRMAAGVAVGASFAVWLWQQSVVSGTSQVPVGVEGSAWTMALQSLNVLRVLAWTLGGLSVLFLLTLTDLARTCGIAVGLTLCCSELTWHASQVLRTIPPEFIRSANAIVAALPQNLGEGRVLAAHDLISDREAWRAGIHKVQGYDPVPLVRLALYAAATAPRQDAALAFAGFDELNLAAARKPLLDLLGVRYAVLQGERRHEMPGWTRWRAGSVQQEFILRGSGRNAVPYTIYENDSALPRAYVLGQCRPLAGLQDAQEALASLDPRQEVVLERDVLPAGSRQAFRPARIVNYASSHVVIEAELDAPGYLVLTDLHYPGWAASVDGLPAAVLPANVAFRAVALPAGHHRIEFRYAPPGAKTGALISLMTGLILVVGLRRNRRTATARGPG